MRVEFTLSIGFPGASRSEEFDVLEDLGINPDLSEEDLKKELEEAYNEWVGNFQDGGWEILEDEPE